MSRRHYFVERTDPTGHWRVHRTCGSQREALAVARAYARHGQAGRRRVTVRVRVFCARHGAQEDIAGWINGGAAWGEAFR